MRYNRSFKTCKVPVAKVRLWNCDMKKDYFIFYFLVFPKDSQTARLASDATIKVKRQNLLIV